MITDKTERCDLYDAIIGSLLDFSEEIKDFKEEINQNKLNKLAWTLIKPNIVNSRKNYINGCKRGSSHPSTGGSLEPSISNSNIDLKKLRSREDTTKNVVEKKKATKFVKPSFDEVIEFVKDNGYSFDVYKFYAHYESNGWKVGKNSMKCWKSACVTWERSLNV